MSVWYCEGKLAFTSACIWEQESTGLQAWTARATARTRRASLSIVETGGVKLRAVAASLSGLGSASRNFAPLAPQVIQWCDEGNLHP